MGDAPELDRPGVEVDGGPADAVLGEADEALLGGVAEAVAGGDEAGAVVDDTGETVAARERAAGPGLAVGRGEHGLVDPDGNELAAGVGDVVQELRGGGRIGLRAARPVVEGVLDIDGERAARDAAAAVVGGDTQGVDAAGEETTGERVEGGLERAVAEVPAKIERVAVRIGRGGAEGEVGAGEEAAGGQRDLKRGLGVAVEGAEGHLHVEVLGGGLAASGEGFQGDARVGIDEGLADAQRSIVGAAGRAGGGIEQVTAGAGGEARGAARSPMQLEPLAHAVGLGGTKGRGRETAVLDPEVITEAGGREAEGAQTGSVRVVVAVEPVGAGRGDGRDGLGRQVTEPVLLADVEVVIGATAGAAHRVERIAVLKVRARAGRNGARGNPVMGVGQPLRMAELVVGRAGRDVPVHPHLGSGQLRLTPERVGRHPFEEDDPAVVLVRIEGAGTAVGRIVGLGQRGGVRLQLAGRGRGRVVEGLVARHPQDARQYGKGEGGPAVGGRGEERGDLSVGGLDFRGGGDRAWVVGEVHLHPEHAFGAEDPRRVRGGRRRAGAGHVRSLARLRSEQRGAARLQFSWAREHLHLAANAHRQGVHRQPAGHLFVVVERAPRLGGEGGEVVHGETVQRQAVLGRQGEAPAVRVRGEPATAQDRGALQAGRRGRAGEGDFPIAAGVEQLLQFRGDGGRQADAEARRYGGSEGRGGFAGDELPQFGPPGAGERDTPGGQRGLRPRTGTAPVGQPLREGRHGGPFDGAHGRPLDRAHGRRRLDRARGGPFDGAHGGPLDGAHGRRRLAAGKGPSRGEEHQDGSKGAGAIGGHQGKVGRGACRRARRWQTRARAREEG